MGSFIITSTGGQGKRSDGDGGPALTRTVQDQIGTRLRAMYEDLKTEPVPDRILDLLKGVERRKERQGS